MRREKAQLLQLRQQQQQLAEVLVNVNVQVQQGEEFGDGQATTSMPASNEVVATTTQAPSITYERITNDELLLEVVSSVLLLAAITSLCFIVFLYLKRKKPEFYFRSKNRGCKRYVICGRY